MLAEYFQRLAIDKHCYGDGVEKELSFVDGKDAEEYLRFAKYCDEYAKLSRRTIADIIIDEINCELTLPIILVSPPSYPGLINIGALSLSFKELLKIFDLY